MIVRECEQRTDEWRSLRLGKLTGSVAGDMLATIKTGEAAARRDLRLRLVCERLTGQSQEDGYVSKDMQRGNDMEAAALAAYEALTGQIALLVGFCDHDTLQAGCSPDGYTDGWTGLVSLKAPKTSTHVGYLRAGRMPLSYVPQMLHEMWITGAKFYDFVSFDDRLPEPLHLFHVRTLRDEAAIEDYARKAVAFLNEVDCELDAIRTMANPSGVLREAAAV